MLNDADHQGPDPDPRSLLILYATETGTAQDAADRIARNCRRIHFQCRVVNMDDYPLEELVSEDLIVFVVSTTGTGIEPRSMTPLWTMLLRSDLPTDLFEDMQFAVFGLGDTSYEKFCWPAKKLSRRLESLGAVEICARGEGDEQHDLGIDGALLPWISKLIDALLTIYPLPPGLEIDRPDVLPPARVSLTVVPASALHEASDPLQLDDGYHTATLTSNFRITAEDWWQDVRHFEFDFEDDIKYRPGDVAVIHPEVSHSDVEKSLVSLGWEAIADEPFQVQQTLGDQTLPDHLPKVTTLRAILIRHINVNDVPRRSFFEFLRHFVTDELEREKLDDFLSDEGADDLYDYCHRVRRTIREVLEEFRSAKIPREYVFDVFPPMRPREFSIASSVKRHPKKIQLCVAIVRYKTRLKIPRKGVATSYLASLRLGDRIRIGLRRGLISLPSEPHIPVICVGPGTGVAPMRAVIEERIELGSTENTLYFGCRSASKDQHYASEWSGYVDGQNLRYRSACSRDGPEGVARVYVQDLILRDSKRVWEILYEREGYLYISGSSNKMPAAIRAAVRSIAQVEGGMSGDDVKEFVENLEREGRLVEECWS
ncbi:hypothetical protein JAAARDRAFT_184230 [Jaapia argillacea MUCL 33604]|uniref:NADPH-dependent diflavin oxidoreductase 1 n=1 Tax=Jaapia argillacea MUCL 33604 TaxID=933084 RepID=A0A067PBQ5_9AGAM|nr:hypothetical protein JAAARDRAFT_184230 [Jaapia argillacea MUCL 33604]